MTDNEKQPNKERLKEIVDSIEKGIQDLFESEKYAQYLRTMSRFHRYSVNNQMLIYLQKPEATLVAGFNKWRDQFERNVMKGEKGIKIIAPTPFKKKVEEQKIDPNTKLPMLDEDGKVIVEEKEIKIPMFKPVTVFDVSQTNGKPLPQLASDLSGNVQNYEIFMEALRRSSPVPIDIRPIHNSADGFFSLEDQRITIREDMSEVQTISATVHEIAHAKLHNTVKDEVPGDDHSTEEVEAESVSFTVCAYYGIATGENSFGYIADWSKGKDLKELRASMEIINKASSELITDIDRNYAEIIKERGSEIEVENLEKPLSEMNILEMIDYFMEQGMTEEEANDLAHEEWQARDVRQRGNDVVEKERLDALYAENPIGSEDWFYHHPDSQTFEAVYFNPDSNAGGQYVIMTLPYELISDAVKQTNDAQSFFEFLEEKASYTELVDITDKDFRSTMENYRNHPADFVGRFTEVMASLIETVVKTEKTAQIPDKDHMPDPSMSIEAMHAYGYTDPNMLPLSAERALELFEHDVTVYMLYYDNTESMVSEAEDIRHFSGCFGVDRTDWELIKDKLPPMSIDAIRKKREQTFLESSEDTFAIYQLKREDSTADLHFAGLDWLDKKGIVPKFENYDLIYAGALTYEGTQIDKLEGIYHTFNINHPKDFFGHSLSVSDIVALKQSGVVSYHYVDSVGYKELPNFAKPENYLKNAEMQVEDDYNMIDGIVNNGPKQPIQKAPARQDAGQPKKPSVLAKLRKYQEDDRRETAMHRSAERDFE